VIEIPSLRSLALGGFFDNHYFIARILATLSTPALENLELLSLDSGCWPVFALIHERKGRVFPTLRSITLLNVRIEKGTIVWLANTFPCITHLVVLNTDLDNFAQILAEQIVYPSNPSGLPIWTELRSCTFLAYRRQARPRTQQLLLDLLSSRKSARMPLVELRCEQSLDVRANLRECLRDGGHFALFAQADYKAYLYRDLLHPNAEQSLIGMNRFWTNNLDVNGG